MAPGAGEAVRRALGGGAAIINGGLFATLLTAPSVVLQHDRMRRDRRCEWNVVKLEVELSD